MYLNKAQFPPHWRVHSHLVLAGTETNKPTIGGEICKSKTKTIINNNNKPFLPLSHARCYLIISGSCYLVISGSMPPFLCQFMANRTRGFHHVMNKYICSSFGALLGLGQPGKGGKGCHISSVPEEKRIMGHSLKFLHIESSIGSKSCSESSYCLSSHHSPGKGPHFPEKKSFCSMW